MASETTQIKNLVEQAIFNYMTHNPDQPLNKEWDYTSTEQVNAGSPSYTVFVKLYPPTRFTRSGCAYVHSPLFGSWIAYLNGLSSLRVGKPTRRYSVDELKKMVGLGMSKPMWPELGY